MRYFLSLGSNQGDRKENIVRALSLLQEEGMEIRRVSSLYETEPVDFASQLWFYNRIAEVQASVKPDSLLALIKSIEQEMGRDAHARKEPRIIDIDIIIAEDQVIHTEDLEIPHPRMQKRNFVLVPFAEISPDTVHPVLKRHIKELLEESRDLSAVHKIKEKRS
ncbi:MAG: 2-amino-4-hydroxy-6-hydroxymethyldihydropteridine diphosphokinase [Candidatus Aminicenantes bacterium]|nr:2-amino-4-hydroxy-6-hydroxymethyldihydropteridine diphosphokinase [Candidatus Aminicenantes bacterium]MDH5466276.1 2-amino-4-hydroxy-6-hydroxymethyldihydropteridine diphosphokinase [Candidatus Aminicenantes bacterium]MDH5705292.1 2-amino-4-hydroxy-6-hydroxymethyldihydropteridine diphosphokinase [Candidatus Aminicenantes bacterium]